MRMGDDVAAKAKGKPAVNQNTTGRSGKPPTGKSAPRSGAGKQNNNNLGKSSVKPANAGMADAFAAALAKTKK
jgi:hypothetical protein